MDNSANSEKVCRREGSSHSSSFFIDDITDQLTQHISRALHADDLAIWTSAEQTTTATVRMQIARNTISQWADEWINTINRIKTEAILFSLSTKKESFSLKTTFAGHNFMKIFSIFS